MGDSKEWMPGTTHWSSDTWEKAVGYAPKLQTALRRMTRSDADAEDATQNAYLRALESDVRRGREPEYVPTFLQTVGRNQYFQELRKERVRFTGATNRVSFEDDKARDCFFNNIADASSTPEKQLAAQEMNEVIERAVKSMSPENQRIFHLYFLERLPMGAVAQAEGISGGAVKSRIHRTREILKQALISHGFGPQGVELDGKAEPTQGR